MKIPVDEALETTQMIVPEVDLKVKWVGGNIHIQAVQIDLWYLYINAMENASDMLLNELGRLPDLKPVIEIEGIASDLGCLISSFNMFYQCMMDEIRRAYKSMQSEPKPNFKRYSRYRRKIDRDGEDGQTASKE